jgi:predicted enzyme related to lactoylglutathione lyase
MKYVHTNIVAKDWRKLADFYIIDVCPTNDRQRIKENPEKQGNIPLDNAITKANVNKVFGCKEVYTKRDLKGKWIDRATGINGVRIEGVHLRLPGHGDNGPTLEIFQYNKATLQKIKRINQQGLTHIAFRVEDVRKTLDAIIKAGGGKLSEIIHQDVPNLGCIILVYAKDPEGNFIELQKI